MSFFLISQIKKDTKKAVKPPKNRSSESNGSQSITTNSDDSDDITVSIIEEEEKESDESTMILSSEEEGEAEAEEESDEMMGALMKTLSVRASKANTNEKQQEPKSKKSTTEPTIEKPPRFKTTEKQPKESTSKQNPIIPKLTERSIVRVGTNGRGKEEIKLYSPEDFTVDDQVVQRITYRACSSDNVPDGARINKIIVFNYTDFEKPGATQWHHLSETQYDLLNFVFSTLSFACGKKEKKPAPKKVGDNGQGQINNTKKKGKKAKSSSNADDDGDDETEASTNGVNNSELKYIQGNDHIFVFLETLVNSDGIVIGYRQWIFDTEIPEKDNLFSRGALEALYESATINNEARQQKIAMINETKKCTTKTKSAREFTDFTVRKEFNYSRYVDHSSLFTNVTKKYFTSDPCLSASEISENNTKSFRDDRRFMDIDTLVDRTYLSIPFSDSNHPCNISNMFNKESAMIYGVCHANADPIQCRLGSYMKNTPSLIQPNDHMDYLNMDEDPNDTLDRFNQSIVNKTDDKNFNQFVYPSITYHLSNVFLLNDFITRMPLPHRIGTKLFTNADQYELHKKFIQPSSDVNSLHDIQQFQLSNRIYLGLHQTECEMNADQMLYYSHHLDDDAVKLISKNYATKEIKDKFTRNITDELYSRLKLILVNTSLKDRVFINGAIEENTSSSAPSNSIGSTNQKKKLSDTLNTISNIMNYTTRAPTHTCNTSAHHIPYMSMTDHGLVPLEVQEQQKIACVKRLVFQRIRELRSDEKTPEMIQEEKEYEDLYYRKKLATGYLPFFKDEIEKNRPFSNTIETIKMEVDKSFIDVEENFLKRNIFLRLSVLNRMGYNSVFKRHYDVKTGIIPEWNEAAFYEDLRKYQDAAFVEFFHEFFRNPSVSMATEGIRSDLLKKPLFFTDPNTNNDISRNRIGIQLPVYKNNLNLRPYSAFVTYVNSFIADQGGITHNYKIVRLLYFSKGHHSRWHPDCNNPKLNIILQGNGMAGKSRAIQFTKKTCPTGVGDMVTHITDHAFNVDRNLDDIYLMYEEFQNKFLGYSSGAGSKSGSSGGTGGGVSAGSDKDTCNFFKARLTSGRTSTFAWCENDDGQRDVRISHASVQGNLVGASNNDFTDADMNVLSRLILVSVAKAKFDTEGLRPQDRTKSIMGMDTEQDREIFEQHKEIHRIQFMTEKMIQSNILGDNIYGVNMEGAKIQINAILDILQKHYGVMTNDVRKREYVYELARLMCVNQAVFLGLMSSITRYLQKDPFDSKIDIGFNPLVMLEGIIPFLVAVKDHVIDGLTSLSCLWYHDYQSIILETFATKKCNLHKLDLKDFVVCRKNESINTMNRSGGAILSNSSASISSSSDNATYTDYNYIRMIGKNYLEIMGNIAMALGDFVVAETDIQKLLHDMEKAPLTVPSYELVFDEKTKKNKLVLSTDPSTNISRKVVEFGFSHTGKHMVSILVHFLKIKLANIIPDDLIEMPTKILTDKEKLDRMENDLLDSIKIADQLIDEDMEEDENSDDEEEEDEDDNDDLFVLAKKRTNKKSTKKMKSIMKKNATEIERLSKEDGLDSIENVNEKDRIINKIGEINQKTDNLIVKAIRDYYENSILENWNNPAFKDVYDSYKNKFGKSPILRYITADPPKGIKIGEVHPEFNSTIASTETGDKDVLFYDSLSMLALEPKPNGKKMVISNHNTISPSVRASLSIYEKNSTSLMKKRVQVYSETTGWEMDQDIDYIMCKEHMRNTGNRTLRSRPEYQLFNYPPSLYMALLDEDDEYNEENNNRRELLEYPDVDIEAKINNRKRKLDDELNPDETHYSSFSGFVESNLDDNSKLRGDVFIGKKKQTKRVKFNDDLEMVY